MKSILITGCNRGIGLGLIKHLVKDKTPPQTIIATCRSIDKAKALSQLADENENVHLLELDVTLFDLYTDFSSKVDGIVKDQGLNVLINNAGVSPKFTRIPLVKAEKMLNTFSVNTVAPIMLTKALIPNLKKASKQNQQEPFGCKRSIVVNTSSILASISQNTDGGFYPYRCSKAALNMATKSMSVDLFKDGILVTSLHPGWVKTDLGGPNAPMDVDTSASSILQFIRNMNESHNGGFYQWDGQKLPW